MVYQFKITLKNISPPIWRRILVPSSYTFWDLHVAIQDAFGWDGSHLHNFIKRDTQTGKLNIIEVPSEDSIGDSLNTKSFDETKEKKYPSCIGDKRACPPEDCGAPWGYKEFLVAIKNKSHERHVEMTEWIGGDFDPEYFETSEVFFDDPKEAWKTYNEFTE